MHLHVVLQVFYVFINCSQCIVYFPVMIACLRLILNSKKEGSKRRNTQLMPDGTHRVPTGRVGLVF